MVAYDSKIDFDNIHFRLKIVRGEVFFLIYKISICVLGHLSVILVNFYVANIDLVYKMKVVNGVVAIYIRVVVYAAFGKNSSEVRITI